MIYIVDQKKLDEHTEVIAKAPELAVDTEADSLHHYHEKLCLLQISTPQEDYVIDPLVPLKLQNLLRSIETLPLILHGADFDLRIMKRFYNFKPQEIFDTMIAAQFLGYSRPSLAALAEKHCGVHLPKTNQKADWSRRPFKESMLVYASNDTHYLHTIARILRGELKERGRTQWVTQTCVELLKATDRKTPPSRRAWRVKGYHTLEGKELVYLRELWLWRDAQAKKRDVPAFKVIHSELLVAMCRWANQHAGKPVTDMPRFPRHMKPKTLESLQAVLQNVSKSKEETAELPRLGTSKRLSRREERRLNALKGARNVLAQEHECLPGVFVSNAVLETLAAKRLKTLDDIKELNCLMDWQLAIVGSRFLDVLREIDVAQD